jgi:hypothetical protein
VDDCWQQCGAYGPNAYTFHDASGAPVVNTAAFPSLRNMTGGPLAVSSSFLLLPNAHYAHGWLV